MCVRPSYHCPLFCRPSQVQQATSAVASRGASASKPEAAVELALDWLFIHLPRAQLPKQFRAGQSPVTRSSMLLMACFFVQVACVSPCGPLRTFLLPPSSSASPWPFHMLTTRPHSTFPHPANLLLPPGTATNAVSVLSNKSFKVDPLGTSPDGSGPRVPPDPAAASRLGAWGYTPPECSAALSACNNDETAAFQRLFEGLTGESKVCVRVKGCRVCENERRASGVR
jgi:hypothetical protein